MDYRILGRTGIRVSPLCLGTMNFGGPTSEVESIGIVQAALDAGINFIDTADVYSRGESERILGKAIAASGQRRPHPGGQGTLHRLLHPPRVEGHGGAGRLPRQQQLDEGPGGGWGRINMLAANHPIG